MHYYYIIFTTVLLLCILWMQVYYTYNYGYTYMHTCTHTYRHTCARVYTHLSFIYMHNVCSNNTNLSLGIVIRDRIAVRVTGLHVPRFHCFQQTCSHWGHGHIALLNTVTQKANTLLEDIFISHCCLLHHLNGAVGRVALKVLRLCGVSCSCFSAIFFVTWDFIMRRCCAE